MIVFVRCQCIKKREKIPFPPHYLFFFSTFPAKLSRMTDFLTSLSRDFSKIMDDSDEFNVLIKVGADENNEKSFQAHSLVLKARSPYFRTALSNNWAKREGNMMVFNKPNISPYTFELLLKYVIKKILFFFFSLLKKKQK